MTQALSLHIGVEDCDSLHYASNDLLMKGAEKRARDYHFSLSLTGSKSNLLLGKSATRRAVYTTIRKAAETIGQNGVFVFSFSGNQANLPNPTEDLSTSIIPTWCLYDAQILLNEVYQLLALFPPGVTILQIENDSSIRMQNKCLTDDISASVYFNNMEFYNQMLSGKKALGEKANLNNFQLLSLDKVTSEIQLSLNRVDVGKKKNLPQIRLRPIGRRNGLARFYKTKNDEFSMLIAPNMKLLLKKN